MDQAKPLSVKVHLAGNPTKALQFSTKIKSQKFGEIELADPRSTRALVALMDMYAVLGGAASHYGGPAAFAEIMSALHGYVFREAEIKKKNWYDLFHVINDAGHCENGLYAIKANYGFANLELNDLKKFRSIESSLTGHGEAHIFPEAVLMSNGPLGSAFPQSQGLAMADSFSKNPRVTIAAISDGACMEGEAREAMAAIPGFSKNGKLAPYVLIISDNNTKLSGRIDKDSFSMAPTFSALQTLGWKLIELKEGHDLQKCFDTISTAVEMAVENPKQPVAIHVHTIKGIGSKKTAESSSGGHGFPLKSPTELPEFLSEIYSGEKYPAVFDQWISELVELEKKIKASAVKPPQPEEKIQVGISNAMIKARKNGLPVVSITSDLPGSTGVAGFRKEFPLDSIDVGVAESNMISTAAGFSRVGYIPVVDTFAQFGVTKGALPLTMASLSEAPMICVFSHTGFQDAADGASHQALSYFSMIGSIPNVDVYALTCSDEAESLMTQAIEKFASDVRSDKTPNSVVFFLGRENFPKSFSPGAKYHLGKAQIVSDTLASKTKKVTLIGSGSMLAEAVSASHKLNQQGIGCVVINPAIHNKPDVETIVSCIEKTNGKFVVVEDHQKISGFGQTLTAEICKRMRKNELRALAVDGAFGQSAYTAQELYKKHGIDSDSVVRAAQDLL